MREQGLIAWMMWKGIGIRVNIERKRGWGMGGYTWRRILWIGEQPTDNIFVFSTKIEG